MLVTLGVRGNGERVVRDLRLVGEDSWNCTGPDSGCVSLTGRFVPRAFYLRA